MEFIRIREVPYAPMRVRSFSAREYLLAPIIIYIITAGPVRSMISRRRRRRNETMAKNFDRFRASTGVTYVCTYLLRPLASRSNSHHFPDRRFSGNYGFGFWQCVALRRLKQSSTANFYGLERKSTRFSRNVFQLFVHFSSVNYFLLFPTRPIIF